MKRLACLLLCLLWLTPTLCVGEGLIRVTIGTSEIIDESADLANDWYLDALGARFGLAFDLYSCSADIDGLSDLWIRSGDMPDVLAGNINLGLYMRYARQGLLGAFPDGWEDDYPNLYADIAATGVLASCQLDGRTYVAPRVIMSPHMDLALDTSNLPWHDSVYIRQDWAEALGVSIGEESPGMTDFDGLADYLRTALAAGAEGRVGLIGTAFYAVRQFLCPFNPYYDYCVPADGAYQLGAALPGTADGIALMKRFYEEGLIDPDFAVLDYNEACNAFTVGRAAAFAGDGHAQRVGETFEALRANDPTVTGYDAARMINLLAPDGLYHWPSTYTFWNSVLVSPRLAESPEKERRVFAMLDYLATLEGTLEQNSGPRGITWELDANGRPVALTDAPRASSVGGRLIYRISPSSQDAYPLVSPLQSALSLASNAATLAMYDQKLAHRAPGIPTFVEVSEFFLHSGEAKDLYNTIDWQGEIVRIVTTPGLDARAEWAHFIEATRSRWEPLLNELNK